MILTTAKKAGALICYDPNIRSHDLSKPEIKNALIENIAFADIVKASDEDMKTIFGALSPTEHFQEIKKINPNAVFVLTLGAEGVVGFTKDCTIELPAKEVNVVSTIGAGDAFNAGMVFFLEKSGFTDVRNSVLEEDNFREMLHSGLNYSAEVCSTLENYVGSR
jgi:fructokinase